MKMMWRSYSCPVGENKMHFRLTWKREWTWILVVFVTLRVLYSLLGALAVSDGMPKPVAAFDQTLIKKVDPVSNALVNVWLTWDTVWYLKIARDGYIPGQPTTAFQPLYPLLTRGAGFLLGGNLLLGALLVSNLAAMIALILLYELAKSEKRLNPNPRQTVLAFLLFPSAFFIFAAYTESVFLMLVLAAWSCAQHKKWLAAGMLGALATLCRLQGALLSPVLLWMMLLSASRSDNLQPVAQLKSIWKMLTNAEGRSKARPILLQPNSLAFLLPALSMWLYTVWLRFSGLGSIPQSLKIHWGISTVMPWEGISLFIWRLFTLPRVYIDYLDISIFVVMLGFTLYATLRLDTAYSLYNWLSISIFFMRGSTPHLLDSFNRYLLLLFPVFFILGNVRNRYLVFIFGLLGFMLEVLLVAGFLDWWFIG